eukprot:snap_masked-scaffold_3-processed-gene-16.29-mRNA-1 protein AED:1.00 eAED:1.00 QI:0/0/0/0/1/1/3/0/74
MDYLLKNLYCRLGPLDDNFMLVSGSWPYGLILKTYFENKTTFKEHQHISFHLVTMHHKISMNWRDETRSSTDIW